MILATVKASTVFINYLGLSSHSTVSRVPGIDYASYSCYVSKRFYSGHLCRSSLQNSAHEVASSKQHKSISATDVLKALELVEFGDIAKNIQGELQGASLQSCAAL